MITAQFAAIWCAWVVQTYARAHQWFDLAFAGGFGFASVKILTARLQ
ncbi:hypothetical protein [Roseobacter sp.]